MPHLPSDPQLSYHLIDDRPAAIFLGPLPRQWSDIPAPCVINMCGAYPNGEPEGLTVFAMPLLDVQERSAMPERAEFESFLASIHEKASVTASYWHCHAGLNRSSLALAAYMHLYRGYRISDAIEHIRARRSPLCLCNSLFEETLRGWYGDDDEQDFVPVDMNAWLTERTGGRSDWS